MKRTTRPFIPRNAPRSFVLAVLGGLCSLGAGGITFLGFYLGSALLFDGGRVLFFLGRPLIAERLIEEAIRIYQQKGDDLGLGNSYFEYAYFFLSPSIDKWEKVYREQGFRDKTATFDNRFSKADEYFSRSAESFEKARDPLSQQGKFDILSNANRMRAFAYLPLKNRDKACAAYNDSLESYRKYLKSTDNPKLNLPSGFATYDDYVVSLKNKAECQ